MRSKKERIGKMDAPLDSGLKEGDKMLLLVVCPMSTSSLDVFMSGHPA